MHSSEHRIKQVDEPSLLKRYSGYIIIAVLGFIALASSGIFSSGAAAAAITAEEIEAARQKVFSDIVTIKKPAHMSDEEWEKLIPTPEELEEFVREYVTPQVDKFHEWVKFYYGEGTSLRAKRGQVLAALASWRCDIGNCTGFSLAVKLMFTLDYDLEACDLLSRPGNCCQDEKRELWEYGECNKVFGDK